jgi:hypothetical protein
MTICHLWARDVLSLLNPIWLQDSSTKVSRYFITAFNVDPGFAADFILPKGRGKGNFNIKYMEAAFEKEAGSGEFFIEFEEKVWEHKLIRAFQGQEAGQVMASTFANLDANESASDALLRVLHVQEKTNIKYTRGTCPPALLAKVQAKQAAAKEYSSKAFDEKTMAAMKQSMALQEETKAAVVKVEDSLQSQAVKLEGIENGVCNVIPDYQKEIELLKQKLAHKTALCDKIEGQKAYQTREIRKQAMEIDELKDERIVHMQERQVWANEKAALLEQVDLCKAITQAKRMTEAAQETAAILSSMISSKRPRGV